MEATPKQIAEFNRFLNYWKKTIRGKATRVVMGGVLLSRLQDRIDSLGLNATVFSAKDASEIGSIVDLFNRMERCISKVELEQYGVNFHDNDTDFDITGPPTLTSEQIMNDEIVITTTFGAIVPLIIMGVLIVGGTWMVTNHLNKRLDAQLEKARTAMKITKEIVDNPSVAEPIKSAITNLIEANEDEAKESGLWDLFFGGKTGTAIAAAIGIGILLFAYMKGRK